MPGEPLKVATTVQELRALLAGHDRPAFVPTMGNLHDGHMALVRLARAHADITVCSIFVNRLQFGPAEDFDSYPRTLDADRRALTENGCDILFAPTEAELYPDAQTYTVHPDPTLADVLEGAHRPGFFTGVSTVVMKLLCCVQPRAAIFGEKDFQQLLVISRLVTQFCLDVEIVPAPIERCADGLAHSSRNVYLSAQERHEAPRLQAVLRDAADRAGEAGADFERVERQAMEALRQHGWAPDYVAVRNAANLQPLYGNGPLHRSDDFVDPAGPTGTTGPVEIVVLAAARLGRTRLIDNVRFAQPDELSRS